MSITYYNFVRLSLFLLAGLLGPLGYAEPSAEPGPESKTEHNSDSRTEMVSCPEKPRMAENWSRSRTYKGVPYQPGEEARYELKYGSVEVHVGYGFMRVGKPLKYKIPVFKKDGKVQVEKRWHRVFSVEAFTGDWYQAIFRANDKLQAFTRPWDHGISKFYISEDHEKPFGKRSRREKWLEFDHINCKVQSVEEILHKNKKKEGVFELAPGAIDALGAVYKLRELDYKVGVPQKFVVYTSEKNWWFEANPLAIEEVKVKAGTFKAVKLDIKTSIGDELEQKGKTVMWFGVDHPQRPLVKVAGEAKFGTFFLELDRFKPGV